MNKKLLTTLAIIPLFLLTSCNESKEEQLKNEGYSEVDQAQAVAFLQDLLDEAISTTTSNDKFLVTFSYINGEDEASGRVEVAPDNKYVHANGTFEDKSGDLYVFEDEAKTVIAVDILDQYRFYITNDELIDYSEIKQFFTGKSFDIGQYISIAAMLGVGDLSNVNLTLDGFISELLEEVKGEDYEDVTFLAKGDDSFYVKVDGENEGDYTEFEVTEGVVSYISVKADEMTFTINVLQNQNFDINKPDYKSWTNYSTIINNIGSVIGDLSALL